MIKIRDIKAYDRGKLYEMMQQDKKYNTKQMVVILHRIDHFLFDPDQIIYRVIIAENENKKVIGCAVFGQDPQSKNSYQIYDIIESSQSNNGEILFSLLQYIENQLIKLKGRIVITEISSHFRYKNEYDVYLEQNYVLTSRISNFYSIGEDKLIFTKMLS